MNNFLTIFIIFLALSCSKKQNNSSSIKIQEEEDILFIKNDTLLDIINQVIDENEKFTDIKLLLLDIDDLAIMLVEIDDIVDDCNNVKAIYKYKNINIIAEDLSENGIFDNVLDYSNGNHLELCHQYEKEFYGINDPKTYPFRLTKEGAILYPNGDPLIYNDGVIKLNSWK